MDITLSHEAERQEVVDAVHQCGAEDAVCCLNEDMFKLAKLVLVQEKIENVTKPALHPNRVPLRPRLPGYTLPRKY